VYLLVSDGGLAFDRTSDIPVLLGADYRTIVESSANPDESYYNDGFGWLDLYDYNFSNPSWDETANFCIKALTKERGISINPEEYFNSSGPVGGPFTPAEMTYYIINNEVLTISFEVSNDLTCDWINLAGDVFGFIAAGDTAEVTVQVNSNANILAEGIHTSSLYFTNTTNHYGDATMEVQLAVGEPTLRYSWYMDTNPSWNNQNQWAYGLPTGGGGQYGGPDPTAGYTGDNVLGYNLYGDYPNNLSETNLTSTAIDCSNMFGVTLKFWRWLGVEQPTYDHAYVRISTDGSNWYTIWENSETIEDYAWTQMELDISDYADDQSEIYLRWVMGETDGGWTYCGWNIDDIEIFAYDEISEPIELSSFEATYDDLTDSVLLNWTTLFETDVIGFNIYRSETDDFAASSKINLSIIPGHGTTTAPQNYEFNDYTATVTTQYYYWLEVINYGGGLIVYGSFIYYPNVSNDDEPVAQFVSLHNYPNPFRKSTQISYSLTKQDKVKIQIYNLKGQLVETLLNENKPAGNYTFEWNVDEMSSGIYFMKLLTKEKEIVRKLVIIK